jgi:hypothetical protein
LGATEVAPTPPTSPTDPSFLGIALTASVRHALVAGTEARRKDLATLLPAGCLAAFRTRECNLLLIFFFLFFVSLCLCESIVFRLLRHRRKRKRRNPLTETRRHKEEKNQNYESREDSLVPRRFAVRVLRASQGLALIIIPASGVRRQGFQP